MKYFNTKEYEITNVLRTVHNQLQPGKCTKEMVIETTKWLFGIFKESRSSLPDTETLEENLRIPIITLDGQIEAAGKVFFGQEYGNQVGWKLLMGISLKKKIFFADYTKFGFSDSELKHFFEYLGVAYFPRKVRTILKGNTAQKYFDYMFKEKDVVQTNWGEVYNHRTKNGSSLMEASVQSLQYFDKLIGNLGQKSILTWLEQDKKLNTIIFSGDTVPNEHSFVSVSMPRKQYDRQVAHGDMPNYILYKLSTSPWLLNSTGTRFAPNQCILNITDDNPLFMTPSIPVKTEAKIILQKLGARSDITELDLDTIYDILSNLPQKDPEGKNAKNLYRKIIKNTKYDSVIWERSKKYKEFIKNSEVLVMQNGKKFFFPVIDAFYMDNRTLSENILKTFPIVEIDKRQGETQVQNIFGIKPLKDIELDIAGEPIQHELNDRFVSEYHDFLPYVYAHRLETDTDKQEFRALRDTNIKLCSEIHMQFKVGDEIKKNRLNDYENLYVKTRSTIFIAIPVGITDLRNNDNFADSLAEALCGLLEVENKRSEYRELYQKDKDRRDSLIRRDLDDLSLALLDKARKLFSLENTDYQYRFWSSIFSLVHRQIPENFKPKDFLVEHEVNENLFEEFDYEHLNNHHESLVLFFKSAHFEFDVEDFNKYSTIHIDLIPFYRKKLISLKEEYKGKYLEFSVNQQIQLDFIAYLGIDDIKQTYNFMDVEFNNSIHLDAEKAFFDELTKRGVNKNDLDKAEPLDANDLLEYEEQVVTHRKAMEQQERERNEKESTPQISSLRSIYEQILLENVKPPVLEETLIKPEITQGKNTGGSGSHKQNNRVASDNNEQNKINGLRGEMKVLEYLESEYGKENVLWCSGYSIECGYDNSDAGDDLGYDIRYKNKQGEDYYVEVKSSRGAVPTFTITRNERLKAENYRQHYLIFFVSNVDNENIEIHKLGALFDYQPGEDFFHNDKFTIAQNDYDVTTKFVKSTQ